MTSVDAELDLLLERRIAAAPALVWRCWTEPELLMQWFTPRPVETIEAAIDPVPGGRFYTRMRLPDGQEMGSEGCILLAEPARRLVFTDALSGGWRPNAQPFMTAILTIAPDGTGTAYTALVRHHDQAAKQKHEEMGFFDGWGTATEQLAALAATLSK